jgi:hypothetical protein
VNGGGRGIGLAQNHSPLSHVTAVSQGGVTRERSYGSNRKCCIFAPIGVEIALVGEKVKI